MAKPLLYSDPQHTIRNNLEY